MDEDDITPGEGAPTEEDPTPEAENKIDTVTAGALADAIVGQVFARLPEQQAAPATKQERVSAFQQKAAALLKDERIDKDVVGVMMELIQGVAEDLTTSQQETAVKQALAIQNQTVHKHLFELIERYSKKDPFVKKAQIAVANEIIEEFNKNPTRAQQYMQGNVDYGAFDKIAVKVVNGWLREPASPGGPSIKPNPAGQKKDAGGPADKNELNEKQLEVYNGQVAFYKKMTDLKPEEVHKKALAAAGRFKSK